MIQTAASPIRRVPMFAAVHATAEAIPPITDPLGRHWRQPDMTQVEITSEHARLTQAQFDSLSDYSTSYPSGVYHGKCWKAQGTETLDGGRWRWTGTWFLRWYDHHEDPKKCSIKQREIIIT
jgi:hypothetical protein